MLSVVCRILLLTCFLAEDDVIWRNGTKERLVDEVHGSWTVDSTRATAVSKWAYAHWVDAVILGDAVEL